MILERVVEIVDISGMMLVMMDLHRAGINVGFERIESIRKWRQGVGHRS